MGRGAQGMDIIIRGGPAGECSRWLVYQGLSKALETAPFSAGVLLIIMGIRKPESLRDI